jgi:hypothetical protein
VRFVRIALVVLIAAYEVAAFVTTLATFGQPVAEYGYTVALDGTTIASVEAGLPAAKAGLEAGDRIPFASLSVLGRLNSLSGQLVAPGTPMQFTVVHQGRARTVTLHAVELPSAYALTNVAFAVAGLALGAVSLVLVLLRPSRMTWGFALIALPVLLPDVLIEWEHEAAIPVSLSCEIFTSLLAALAFAGIMVFASRFPSDQPHGLNRFIDRVAVPCGIAIAAVYLYVIFTIFFGTAPPPSWMLFTQDYLAPTVPSLAGLVALVTTFAISSASMRSRLTPALLAFVLTIVTDAAAQYVSVATSNARILLLAYFAFPVAAMLLAGSVAYAVVRHRVIDVSFIVGRTLVYSILTIFAVSIFTLIEFFVGKLLEHNGLASLLEIVAALALGLSLNALHNVLDKFVELVLFRRRHLAEARLKRITLTLPHAVSTEIVADMLVEEPAEALDLASAAVFVLVEDEARYVRARAEGWDAQDAAELDLDDHLVVRLRAELKATHLTDLRWPRSDVPSGNNQPIYAVPVAIGSRLEALVLYGAHSGGEDLDPNERRSLRALARGAALAYDHLRAQALRKSLEEARRENAALRRVERTLTTVLENRLKGAGGATE